MPSPSFPPRWSSSSADFPDDDACAAWLVAARWPSGFRCRRAPRRRGGRIESAPLRMRRLRQADLGHGRRSAWFEAAFDRMVLGHLCVATHSIGIRRHYDPKQLGLGSYKSAWLLCAKLRHAMVAPGRAPLAGLVEVDETEIPFRARRIPVCETTAARQGKMFVAGPGPSKSTDRDTPSRDQGLLRRLAAWLRRRQRRPGQRRSNPTAPSFAAPQTSGTNPMSSAPWPPYRSALGPPRLLQRRDLGTRRLSRTAKTASPATSMNSPSASIDAEPATPPSAGFSQSPSSESR